MNRDRLRRRQVAGGGGDGIIVTDPWHYFGDPGEPTLENGFAHVAATKGGFRKVGDYVEIAGVFFGGNASTTIFTLPVGYRPDNNTTLLAIIVDVSTGGAVNQFEGFIVNPDGTVVSGDNFPGYTLPLWSASAGVFLPLTPPEDV